MTTLGMLGYTQFRYKRENTRTGGVVWKIDKTAKRRERLMIDRWKKVSIKAGHGDCRKWHILGILRRPLPDGNRLRSQLRPQAHRCPFHAHLQNSQGPHREQYHSHLPIPLGCKL